MTRNQLALLLLPGVLASCSPSTDDTNSRGSSRPGTTNVESDNRQSIITIDDDILITSNNATRTQVCTGQNVRMVGNNNRVYLSGKCQKFYAIGNYNTVILENVESVQVNGSHNLVAWRGTKPEIGNLGEDNELAAAQSE